MKKMVLKFASAGWLFLVAGALSWGIFYMVVYDLEVFKVICVASAVALASVVAIVLTIASVEYLMRGD